MIVDRKFFFDNIRHVLFSGHLSEKQVLGINAILDEFDTAKITVIPWMAAILATAYHETGQLMVPVREGFASTDAGARAAVANLYARGKISRNYALPHANGNSYYGRGHCQLTHGDNYKKASKIVGVDLYANPDKALDPHISAKLMIVGMVEGTFTGHKLSHFLSKDKKDYFNARAIINGDKNKAMRVGKRKSTIGKEYERYSLLFERALKLQSDPKPLAPEPVNSYNAGFWDQAKGLLQTWLAHFSKE